MKLAMLTILCGSNFNILAVSLRSDKESGKICCSALLFALARFKWTLSEHEQTMTRRMGCTYSIPSAFYIYKH